MIEPAHQCLSITAQCRLLSISRSSYYYAPPPEAEEALALMRVIDAAFLDCPWYGSRQMVRHLQRAGHQVGRRRVRRLMAKMGLSPIYQRPRTSDPHPQHRIYPYLLRKLTIERPNHVWCADVTYIPMRRGFLYLAAIMDWATRKVLAWRLSNTMDAGFCVAALEEALARFGKPEIFNTDQGSQFTSFAFTSVLRDADVRISMDGRGRWMDSDIFRAQPPVKSRGFLSGERPSRQFDSILHTAPIARGNSGGPLLDGCGRVIGVNSFGADSEAGDAEFYFAVSTRELLPFLRDNGIDAQVNSLPCRSIEDLDAAERARVEQQRADARERLALREAELRDKRARAQLEAQVAVQDERESMVALALVLIMLAGASGIYAMQLRQKGETDQRFKIAVAVSAAALLGAIAVWLTRPGLSEIDERVAAAMDGEQGLVGQSVAQASESNLLCTLVPERSRVTGAKTDDVEFDWQDGGCVNTRTQYGYANGEWSRVFVPDDEDAISVNVFDPQTQTFRTDRYPLGRAAMAKARDARAAYSPPMCGADNAAQELGAQQQGVLSMLPTRPNERLVYSCAPHVRTGGAGSGE